MITDKQRVLAKKFHALHHQKNMFVLANVWNGGSAKIFEENGFQALATTSAGIAFSLGYEDGEEVPFELLVQIVKQINQKTNLPLSVDFERGYGETGDIVSKNAKKLLEVGAIGFNIEDGLPSKKLDAPSVMQEKISSLVNLKQQLNLDFTINARTDVYWHNIASDSEKLTMAIERGKQYVKWGADCIFLPGNISHTAIKILVKEIPAPINIILTAGTQNYEELNRLGVKRLSLGSAPARFMTKELIQLAEKSVKHQYDSMFDQPLSYHEANAYFHEKPKHDVKGRQGYL